MAEPTIISPSTGAVKMNGATTKAQPPAPEVVTPAPDREAALQAREEAIAARENKYRNELKKNAAEKNGLGAKLSRLSELEKATTERAKVDQLAKLNPPEYLKSIYGDGYLEVIQRSSIDGVPPASLIAAELQKVREEFRNVLAERDQKSQQEATATEQREEQEARAIISGKTKAFYDSNATEYPVFKKLGPPERVALMLADRIESTFKSTGKLLTEKEAADGLEGDVLSLLDDALTHDKYKSKLQSKLSSEKVPPSSGVQGSQGSARRTLSNHLTASSVTKTPPRSDAERLERATSVFNQARAKSQT